MKSINRRDLMQYGASGLALGGIATSPLQALINQEASDINGLAPDYQSMIDAPGGKVYVRSNGNVTGNKTPLVLIHGGPGSCHANLTPSVLYRQDRPIILYDQLDCGLSEAPNDPENWRIERFVDELSAVLEHFGADQYHVLGHSWGSTVLFEHVLANPNANINGLVFLGGLFSTQGWIADTDKLRTQLPIETQRTLTNCNNDFSSESCDAALTEFYANFLRRESYSTAMQAYRSQIDNLWNQGLYEYMWGPTEFVSTGTLKSYDGTDQLDELSDRNALFATAEYDEAIPESYEKLAEAASADFAVIDGGAHAILIDNPKAAMSKINTWLESIES